MHSSWLFADITALVLRVRWYLFELTLNWFPSNNSDYFFIYHAKFWEISKAVFAFFDTWGNSEFNKFMLKLLCQHFIILYQFNKVVAVLACLTLSLVICICYICTEILIFCNSIKDRIVWSHSKHVLEVYVKEGLLFAQDYLTKTLTIFMFSMCFILFNTLILFPLSIIIFPFMHVFHSVSSNIVKVLSVGPSGNVFSLETLTFLIRSA